MSTIGKDSLINFTPITNLNSPASIDDTSIVDMLSRKMSTPLAERLSTRFSADELKLIDKNGLIGENGLIGTNGVMSVKNYSGIPESVLWKMMKKKPERQSYE